MWNGTEEVLPIELTNNFGLLVKTKSDGVMIASYNQLTKYFQDLDFHEIKDVELWCWLPTGVKQ